MKKKTITLQVNVTELEMLVRGLSEYRNQLWVGDKHDREAKALKEYLGAKLEENDA